MKNSISENTRFKALDHLSTETFRNDLANFLLDEREI